ncbi:bifunctional DNA primase/polymerase, partial [Methanomethylovorans sp.]
MMTTVTNEAVMYEASKAYQDIGFYIHPLRAHDKIPIVNKWSEIDKHFTESELKSYFDTKDPKNIGLICGELSDCTVIDRDFIVKGLWEGLDISPWVRQQRTGNRDHLFFKYCDELTAKKYHALGFEILNNGNNCVLTPSIHPSGDKYQFTQGEPENRPQMSNELIDRIKANVATFEALQRSVNNCRHVFRKFFKAYFTDNQRSNPHYRDMSIFHGASGRELTLYFFAELKANGATFEELVLLCKLIFLDEYDSADSEYQIGKIATKATARTETIKAHPILSQFYDASEDVKRGKQGKEASHATEQTEPEREEVPEHIKARAREIAKTGDPVSYILQTCDGLHVGDDGVKKTLLVS